VVLVSNTLLGQQLRLMIERRITQRFASHLCPLHQGTEILRIVKAFGNAGILRNEAFISRSVHTVWGCVFIVHSKDVNSLRTVVAA